MGRGKVVDVRRLAHGKGDDGLFAAGPVYGFIKLATVGNPFQVQGDGPGVVIIGQIIQNFGNPHIRGVAHAHAEADAHAVVAQIGGQDQVHAAALGYHGHRAGGQAVDPRHDVGRHPQLGGAETGRIGAQQANAVFFAFGQNGVLKLFPLFARLAETAAGDHYGPDPGFTGLFDGGHAAFGRMLKMTRSTGSPMAVRLGYTL